MSDDTIIFRPIGFVHSPYKERGDIPHPPKPADKGPMEVHVLPEFREGLRDIEGFDRVWLIVYIHKHRPTPLRVTTPIDSGEHGVFTTRSPDRPNPIGLSCGRLVEVNTETGVLRFERLDFIDGTPVLDIKPYLPESDAFPEAVSGWHGEARRRQQGPTS